ncbi:hypothetical protein COY28_01590, partial [Candidatus Woesearchaeota archaeon CG_4_10_14_0_2_um_filter_57_5]
MQHLTEPKNMFSGFLGILLLAFGGIPLLGQFGVLKSVPAWMTSVATSIGVYVIAAAGFIILVDGIMEDHVHKHPTIIAGLVFLALGIVAVLGEHGSIPFKIPLPPLLYYILFTVEAFFLLMAWLTML